MGSPVIKGRYSGSARIIQPIFRLIRHLVEQLLLSGKLSITLGGIRIRLAVGFVVVQRRDTPLLFSNLLQAIGSGLVGNLK